MATVLHAMFRVSGAAQADKTPVGSTKECVSKKPFSVWFHLVFVVFKARAKSESWECTFAAGRRLIHLVLIENINEPVPRGPLGQHVTVVLLDTSTVSPMHI